MFDIGFMELLVIGVVALIVVGPKDLPGMFRTVGRYVGKAKAMAREFQKSMEEAADASGLTEATKGLKDINNLKNYKPDAAIKKKFTDIVDARDTGVPLKDDTGEADDDAAAIRDGLMDDAPKPEPKAKSKSETKPKTEKPKS